MNTFKVKILKLDKITTVRYDKSSNSYVDVNTGNGYAPDEISFDIHNTTKLVAKEKNTEGEITVMWEQDPSINKNYTVLTDVLRGYIGYVFYCTLTATDVILISIDGSQIYIKTTKPGGDTPELIILNRLGELYDSGECVLWPAKMQRDWKTWVRDNPPILLTLPDILEQNRSGDASFITYVRDNEMKCFNSKAFAYTVISYLIHTYYNRSFGTPNSNVFLILWDMDTNKPKIKYIKNLHYMSSPFVFTTYELANLFVSFPENVDLLYNFFNG